MFRSFRRSRTVALGLAVAIGLSAPALAEAGPVAPEVCGQWASRGSQNAVRAIDLTATCRLPARIARRQAERIALAAAQPDAVYAPPPMPSRYTSMLILGVGF